MTNIVTNSFKEKYVYSGYGIAFDGKGEWSFGNDYGRNIIIFGNSSSSHADNCKNNFLILGEGDTFGINGSFGAPEKKLVLILLKQTQTFASVYIIMPIIDICLLMEKKSLLLTFQIKFVSEVFSATESREVSLNGNGYDFLVNYNSIDKI